MLTLNTIPNETINQIVSSLSNYDLAQISLTSHLFHAIAQSHLYQDPYLRRPRDSITFPRPLQIFIRTLLHRPSLATHVRSITLSWGRSPVGLSTGPDHTLFTAAATRLHLDDSLNFESGQVILLLHLLPNLHHVLFGNYEFTDDIFDHFLESLVFTPPTALPPALQSVHDVAFCCDCNDSTLRSAITLLKLPRIRTLRLSIVEDLFWEGPSPNPFAARSTVTRLVLGYCRIRPVTLARVLEMPFALTHFTYFEEPGDHSFDCAVMRRGLETSRLTLQCLKLRIPDSLGSGFSEEEDSPATIGSLREWPMLRSVRCPMSVFVSKWPKETGVRLVDVLPRVLTKFSVVLDWYWETDEIEGKLVELLETREMEGLKKMTAAWVAGEGFVAACGRAGVVLKSQMNCK